VESLDVYYFLSRLRAGHGDDHARHSLALEVIA
jgi:hypothetical protein